MTSPFDPDQEVRAPQARPEDEQWWANRIAAQAAERERANQGSGRSRGADGGPPRATGMRSAWSALGGGSLSNLSGDSPYGGGSAVSRQYGAGDFSLLENPDAARSALYLLVLSLAAGVGAALAVLLLGVIAAAAVGL